MSMDVAVAVPKRRALLLKALLTALVVIAWVAISLEVLETASAPAGNAGAHHHHIAHGGALAFWGTLSMWMVMMVAMMVPVVFPWVAALARLGHGPPSGARRPVIRRPVMAAAFLAGYFAAWLGFSTGATVLQWCLSVTGALSSHMMENGLVRGAAFVLLGAYQWSPLKNSCLTHCESPFTFFLSRWRDGAWGALLMGAHHGLYCIGCCWLLMLGMIAIGAMSFAWMVGVTLFILLEMYVAELRWVSRAAGAVLIVAGLASAAVAL
ncbi:DUF2182 domain-containing protein [Azospirillum canadense]|uniref:DUF2182 domain-containing protein n=1 Tax=Azospirillum canadense TaxID=403962 RepID=UPI00222713C0|nr:DUF2182 domain-containing protein [Azospirillum canadense]MCW2241390.1 putative metal-binding membrane protein [Azospirillum canadense]